MFIFAFLSKPHEHGILSAKGSSDEGRAAYSELVSQISVHQRELGSPRVAGRIGIVYSTTAALQSTGDLVPRHASAAFGLFRNSHYQTDFIPEERCNADYLKRYDLVVLPTACVLKPRETDALAAYLNDGGHIWAFAGSLPAMNCGPHNLLHNFSESKIAKTRLETAAPSKSAKSPRNSKHGSMATLRSTEWKWFRL